MGKERIETTFSKEEVEILRSSLLERYTYYGYKIANSKISKLKAPDEKSADKIQKEIDFYSKYKDCLNKWLDFFRSDEKWNDMY